MENLASESNAAKINRRFKELENIMDSFSLELATLNNILLNQQQLIENQNKVIADLYVLKYGSGPTVMQDD